MSTQRLYLTDSLLLGFEGRVLGKAKWGDAPSLLMDRSAFYPEGGGQLGDRGVLRWGEQVVNVRDVQVDDEGVVHHLVEGEVPDEIVGATLRGEIEEARRRDHMSQHTGQHMLSCALLQVAGGETVSSRLGSETSTIDLNLAAFDDALAARAEDVVNALVLEDRPVRTLFPTEEELVKLPLRRTPKVTKDVRVIEVEGFDFSPCGGTHCQRTGQVGLVRIIKTERYKGGTRVTFVAGARTMADYREKDAALRELGRALRCGPLDVLSAVTKLRNDLKNAQEALGVARAALMQSVAEKLLSVHTVQHNVHTVILAVRDGEDVDALRVLAGTLARRGDVVAIAASKDATTGDFLVVVERGAEAAKFDAGKWLRAQSQAFGGRGGGKAEHAEGRLAATVDWDKAVTAAKEI